MRFFTHLLFESPLRLGALSFLLFGAVLFARQRWEPGAARRYALPATLFIIALLFVVQARVVTQREELRLAMHAFVSAIEREDTTTIGDALSRNYAAEGMDREAFTGHLASFLELVDIRDTRFIRRDLDMGDGSAVMTLTARATVSIRGQVGQFHWGLWRIAWLRDTGGWKIVSLRPLEIDGQPLDTLRALEGHLR